MEKLSLLLAVLVMGLLTCLLFVMLAYTLINPILSTPVWFRIVIGVIALSEIIVDIVRGCIYIKKNLGS